MLEDRLPPSDVEAEENVLGALLIDGEAILKIGSILKPTSFYREKNGWVYEACLNLTGRGEAIDEVTVAHELSRSGKLEPCGGAAYLSHLVSIVASPVHIEHHAKIVRRMSLMHQLINKGLQIMEIGYTAGPDCDLAISQSMELVSGLVREGVIDDVLVTPQQWADYAEVLYSELATLKEGVNIPCGFSGIEELGGIQPGEYVIIAAQTGVGKTTITLQMAESMARIGPVLFCSLDMGKRQTTHRVIAKLLGVPIRLVARGDYSEEFADRIRIEGVARLSESNIYFYGREIEVSPKAILLAAQRMQAKYGLTAIFVDYLQLMADDHKGKSAYQTISNISTDLKNLSRGLDVPVIGVSQLSRAVEQRATKRPTKADLRDSGVLEENVDWLLFLYRESYFWTVPQWANSHSSDDPYPEEPATLIIAKHRQGGELLDIPLRWLKMEQKYIEASKSPKGVDSVD